MEIINENKAPEEAPQKKCNNNNVSGTIFLGVVLVISGILWLLYNFNVVGALFFDIVLSWQVLMMLIGGYLLAIKSYTAGSIVGGLGLIFFLIDICDMHISIMKVVLPSVIIVVGISLILTKLRKK